MNEDNLGKELSSAKQKLVEERVKTLEEVMKTLSEDGVRHRSVNYVDALLRLVRQSFAESKVEPGKAVEA